MSRKIMRVPVGFTWPLNEVWAGYLSPGKFKENECPDCGGGGDSPYAKRLKDLWYGYVPFTPENPLTPDTPGVRAFAERNVGNSSDYYGIGEAAIRREARRLAGLWNGQWAHHLSQQDVDALVADGRLRDFTHTWTKADGWVAKDPPYVPTAAEVNAWSLSSMGHDSINSWVVITAACERAGEPERCAACEGYGSTERYPGQRAECEAWKQEEPPVGDGWQVWETTSEGSPISPVFADQEGIIEWLMSPAYNRGFSRPLTREQAEAFVGEGSSIGSMVVIGGRIIPGDAAVHELAEKK